MGVFLYIAKRLGIAFVLLVISSFIVFAGVRTTIDPTAGLAASKDPTARAQLREKLGLDRPLIEQYLDWASGAVRGDLGVGDRDGEEVTTKLARGLSQTVELIFWGALLAGCLGITFGIVAAIKRNHFIDYALSGFSYFGIAIPVFAFAYVLMNLFAFYIPIKWLGQDGPWLYTSGISDGKWGQDASGMWSFTSIFEYFRHMAMPVIVLSIQLVASWSRYQRASMVEALQSDYIRTAHSKGMSKFRVYFRHAFRNSQLPMITVIALDVGLLFQGLIYTEVIFSMPGMGRVFLKAIDLGDATTITGWLLVTATFVIIANLCADLLLPVIDPRIRTR